MANAGCLLLAALGWMLAAAGARAAEVDSDDLAAPSWTLNPRMVALAVALAGAAVWLVLQGRREARRDRAAATGGLPPRRRPRSRNARAQGLVTLLLGLKFGKVLISGGSMLASVAAYALFWGWRYAAGLVALLFVHELGHIAAARLRGVSVSLPAFVPFMGAFVLTEATADPDTEFQISIGGPLLGTLGAFAALLWGEYAGSGLAFAIAYTGFSLNLFNLMPVPGLDGGKATDALGPWVWLAGVPVLLGVAALTWEPLLLLVALLALPHAFEAWRSSRREPRYWFTNRLSPRNRTVYAAILFGLASLLAVMMVNVHVLAQATLWR